METHVNEEYTDVHHYIDGDYEKPKELFKFIAHVIEQNVDRKDRFSLLDVGCSKGEFLYFIKKYFSKQDVTLTGIDFSRTLIGLARQFPKLDGVEFLRDRAESFKRDETYDIITATGLIGFYDDCSEFFENLLSHLKPGGAIIITDSFTTTEYDVIVRYRRYDKPHRLLEGWNQHSIGGVKAYFRKKGRQLKPHRFELPFRLERSGDVVRSWTLETSEGQKFTNGLNLIWNVWSLEIK